MITKIKAKGFKGQDFDQEISLKTIFIGKNGAGKSSCSQAFALLTLGYIPWSAKPKKKPADILDAYGTSNELMLGAVIYDYDIERKFIRRMNGSVTQKFRINGHSVSKEDFTSTLARIDAPKPLDLSTFLGASDKEKINTLFALFPPAGNVTKIEADLENKTEELNRLNQEKNNLAGMIQRLTKSVGGIQKPSGTLAEIQQEINSLLSQVKEAQENLKQIEIDEAKAQVEQRQPTEYIAPTPANDNSIHSKAAIPSTLDFVEAIQRIINTLGKTDCTTCAAMLVAKKERQKFI